MPNSNTKQSVIVKDNGSMAYSQRQEEYNKTAKQNKQISKIQELIHTGNNSPAPFVSALKDGSYSVGPMAKTMPVMGDEHEFMIRNAGSAAGGSILSSSPVQAAKYIPTHINRLLMR